MLSLSQVKTLSASLLVSAMIVGCSATQDISLSELDAQNASILSADEESQPVIVSFNKDYKTTVAENEPIAKADPKAAGKYFLKLVNSAKKTLDGSFYDIQDPEVVQAFVSAKKRGVNVRLVTDDENLMDKKDPTKPRQSIIDLRAAGIEVKDDKRAKLMHNKFMIVDNKTIWTGSMNLTTSSMYHHNNNSIQIKSDQMAANFNAEFKRLFEEGNFGVNPHTIPYPTANVSGMSMRTFFSPGGGTKQVLVDELKKATKSIRVMAFSMTDKDMLQVMLDKKKAGVKVEAIFDECLVPQYSIYWGLRSAGINTYKDGNQALMHHKVMIIDDETVVTGSFNFSKSADEGNNENCVIIKSAPIAKQYYGEFVRVRSAAIDNKNIPPYDHPACKHDAPSQPAKNGVVGVESPLWDRFIKE